MVIRADEDSEEEWMKKFFVILALLMVVNASDLAAATKKVTPPKPLSRCTIQTASDGTYKGFTWKPNAAHFWQALTILPGMFVRNNTGRVDIYTMKGALAGMQKIKGDGICLPGMKECVNRPSFLDLNKSGGMYQAKFKSIWVRAYDKRGRCYGWYVKSPGSRVD